MPWPCCCSSCVDCNCNGGCCIPRNLTLSVTGMATGVDDCGDYIGQDAALVYVPANTRWEGEMVNVYAGITLKFRLTCREPAACAPNGMRLEYSCDDFTTTSTHNFDWTTCEPFLYDCDTFPCGIAFGGTGCCGAGADDTTQWQFTISE